MVDNIVTSTADLQPQIEIEHESDDSYPQAFMLVPGDGDAESNRRQAHDDLLAYLQARLTGDVNRLTRIRRFADADRLISTWQKLTPEDTARKKKQDETGKPQALAMNMPLTHTHIDDMVSFFVECYYPSTGAYGSADAIPDSQKQMTDVINKMNDDAADTQYYPELTRCIRSLLKYNQGGILLDWEKAEHDSSTEPADQPTRHRAMALDMYNTLWDPSVQNIKDVRRKAEWAAHVEVVNRMELIRKTQDLTYAGTQCIIDSADAGSNPGVNSKGMYYRYPPSEANIDNRDAESSVGQTVNWQSYGASLGESSVDIRGGFELVRMYCWINPAQFGLTWAQLSYPQDGYYLWEFRILSGERIIYAQPVNTDSDDLKDQQKLVIPFYMGYLNYDDMLGAERSIAELMNPFQSFTNFLMNAHVAGARSSIWGIKGYDPSMFDMSTLDASDGTAGYVASKQPGRDVRTGLTEIKGTFDGSKTMDQVGAMLNVTQQFFPAQALPNQVAQIDRAVTNQVAAVLQGVNRRLQLLLNTADQMIFNPLRFDQYRRLVNAEVVRVSGVSDGQARKMLGSGLAQLNQEILENAIRQMLMSIMQNQQLTQQYDVASIFDFWASLLRIPVNSSKFRLQPNPNPPATPAQVDAQTESDQATQTATAIAAGAAAPVA